MLVLSFKKGEKLVLGDAVVTIQVCEVRGDKVKLGIVAPKEIAVNRESVWQKAKEEVE